MHWQIFLIVFVLCELVKQENAVTSGELKEEQPYMEILNGEQETSRRSQAETNPTTQQPARKNLTMLFRAPARCPNGLDHRHHCRTRRH
ncbi:unnamed protein product [Hermetia illucens]|uniref:Uncharacterized protein n=1 Tax=Hermetia illucens TaxID=343691 RepID=A0A7R8UUY6_HERIL|nr:unnamed protein product [Hermetia illucens]